MNNDPKYRYPEDPGVTDRVWPTRKVERMPRMVPVDLRDGNQAFATPMDVETKLKYFQMLVEIGFKEIEAGFPAASTEEYEFVRRLIEENRIPEDVRIVVFTAAKEALVERTVQSIAGIHQAVVHCYVASSDLHREFVFHRTHRELIDLAVDGTKMVVNALKRSNLYEKCAYEFSPEEFSDSDPRFIVEVAEKVRRAWGRDGKENFIFNLPATVERRPPNQYADLIELFTRNYSGMTETTLSIHTHNDQGCAVAAAELAVLAGAERIEGTLCGHGERTGNMDIITFTLNMMARGIETGLDFRNLPEIVRFVEQVSGIRTDPRHPYTGELVFTAFSGTHQDAIRKGMAQRKAIAAYFHQGWKMPYLLIDPADIGRGYEGLIRINSQSGKGGVAYVLESVYGIPLPKTMQPEVAKAVQMEAERCGGELSPEEVYRIFLEQFVNVQGDFEIHVSRIRRPSPEDPEMTEVELQVCSRMEKAPHIVSASAAGPIEAVVNALRKVPGIPDFQLENYSEHALGSGADARAVALIALRFPEEGTLVFGAGMDGNVNLAAVSGIVSALNRRGAKGDVKK